jgi:hypothetical protein
VCVAGYEGGSITCTAADGLHVVVACTAITCGADESVTSNACVTCGSLTNVAGDDASGSDTTCDQACDLNEPTLGDDMVAIATDGCDGTVGDAACTHVCAAGYEGGSITCTAADGLHVVVACTAITCGADESVTSNACVSCATGKTRAAGDDASGADTACATPPTPAATTSDATHTAPLLGIGMIFFSLAWCAPPP